MMTAIPGSVPFTGSSPVVSVIVPARNEESCLGACLASLLSQREASPEPASEIIVVDDHSTDRTRQIAASFPGVRVIQAGPLPQGWTGKNNSVATGAREARGEWLLFTDADTVHLPGSLARSLVEAKQHGAAMLSYSPQQIVVSFWEKAVMPVIFAELAGRYRPAAVSDPNSPLAAANGQYILIRRDVYESVGGHTAIAGDLLEDVALAAAAKRSGKKIFFRYGGDAVRTRMYRNFHQLREGWTKNLALLFPSPLWLALGRGLEFIFVGGCLVLLVRSLLTGDYRRAPIYALGSLITFARVRKAHFLWDTNLLALFGLPLFSYLLLRSTWLHRRGLVSWKGRDYKQGSSPAFGLAVHATSEESALAVARTRAEK